MKITVNANHMQNRTNRIFGGQLIIIFFILVLYSCKGGDQFAVTSPDGTKVLRIATDDKGSLSYEIFDNGILLIPTSGMGVVCADTAYSFTKNLVFADVAENTINETYQLPTGKVSTYHNKCNEKIYRFRNNAGNQIAVECRAYDDGVAFRYIVEKEGDIEIVSEATRFNIPENALTWIMNYRGDYEMYYLKRNIADITDETLSYPALVRSNDRWMLLTEASLFDHPGTQLHKAKEGGLKVGFPEKSFTVSRRYESPWRTFIMCGDRLGPIVESIMVENLNPPSVIDNSSQFEPGVAVFPWWGNYMANSYIDTLKMYVDMAAEMNWNWIEFDVSLVGSPFRTTKLWETTPWLKEFTDYATAKGILVYGWDEIEILKTKEGRDHVYGRYRDLGIKGIKIDYLNSDRLSVMQFREDALRDAAEYGLAVSFHGESLPHGQRRKYPNLMTCEAVRGAEYYTVSGEKPPTPEHNCTLPFTRNVVGPMDYTPTTFTVRKENPRITTYAHELALPFIFESGWTVMADRPKEYLQSPAKELLKKIKATWDETIFIDGYPGEFACMARRNGSEWFLTAINAGKERTVKVKTDFLKEGTYTFKIYEDQPESPMQNINIREITASAGDELEFKLIPNGGFCAMIQKP